MLDNPLSEAVWKRNMTHDLMMFVGFPSASLKISYVISVTHQERIFIIVIIVLDSEGLDFAEGNEIGIVVFQTFNSSSSIVQKRRVCLEFLSVISTL